MGIKLHGFLCDSCRTFRTFGGVKLCEDDLKDFEDDSISLKKYSYMKLDGWEYYNYNEDFTTGWIRLKDGFKCYCPKCARLLKLNKLISKLKRND